jgi:hypothetical protein
MMKHSNKLLNTYNMSLQKLLEDGHPASDLKFEKKDIPKIKSFSALNISVC